MISKFHAVHRIVEIARRYDVATDLDGDLASVARDLIAAISKRVAEARTDVRAVERSFVALFSGDGATISPPFHANANQMEELTQWPDHPEIPFPNA